MKAQIKEQILSSIQVKQAIFEDDALLDALMQVVNKAVQLYKTDNKIILAGNGGSAADAQHIAAELVGRYVLNRPALGALALTTDTSNLTAIANDFGYETVFSRQLEGMGHKGDMFIGISTSGNSENVLRAFDVAKQKAITTVALVGKDGGKMAQKADISIIVPHDTTARIQESHILLGHIMCAQIENTLFEDAQ